MSEEFRQYFDSMSAWAARAHTEGWLNDRDLERLRAVEIASAGELFVDRDRRPLIVGFFGGTGVGKSSLLNRLARHPVAAAGVRRPTSTRATMYVHRSQTLNGFPEGSPVSDTQVNYHDVDARRDVAWLDMPDIDSVEADNRRLVLAWLPYVDWLIYVVSPERYRDDIGWQLVQARHHKHHWLFVINRWDEAVNVQLGDFAADLRQAGFDHPRLLRTSCTNGAEDDFDQLEDIVTAAIRNHGLEELQRIGVLARLQELEAAGDDLQRRFGSESEWQGLCQQIGAGVRKRLDVFGGRLGEELDFIAQKYPPRPAIWRADPVLPSLPEGDLSAKICSSYAITLIDDITVDVAVMAEEKGIRGAPCSAALSDVLGEVGEIVLDDVRTGLAEAVKAPAGTLQRNFRRSMGLVGYVLPALTGGWVAWNVVARYRQGLAGQGEFFGIDFAVHSIFMIGLAWFVPFFLSRMLRPSLRDAAHRGIRSGLGSASKKIHKALKGSLDQVCSDRQELLEAYPVGQQLENRP